MHATHPCLSLGSYDDSNSSRFPKRELAVAGLPKPLERAGTKQRGKKKKKRPANGTGLHVPVHPPCPSIIYVPIIHPSAAPVSLRAYPSTPSRRGSGGNLFQVLEPGTNTYTHDARWMIGPLELDA